MSNILIIKHGSLGDIVQISGVLSDIRHTLSDKKIFILTTPPYSNLLKQCPFVDNVLIDKRLPRWNLLYLIKLKKMIESFNFSQVYDLQNSSRTSFYRKFLFNIKNWSSTETILKEKRKKEDFDQNSVLNRFKYQLENSGIKIKNSLSPDIKWLCKDVDDIVKKLINKKFILLLPFCSAHLSHKKWPYYNQLIEIIKKNYKNFEIVIAPAPNEINEANEIKAKLITNENKSLDIMELAGLIKKSSFIIGNDTGPSHMAAHLQKEGVVLFGQHTTASKVSIETERFKAISVKNLNELNADSVFTKIKTQLDLIN
tara:strand:+ start:1801 stop:2739 length:939 start_codon:yes stop_codon:yes gene_type:complete